MESRKNLLLVDPLLTEQQALVDALFAAGYEVRRAANAAEATAVLRDFQPDLLLAEVQLPGDMDGLGLVEVCKGHPSLSTMPIILYGQSPSLPQRIRGLELGVADFLEKPLYLKEILSRIQLLLEKHALHPPAAPAPKTQGTLADENLLLLLQRMLHDHISGLLELHSDTQAGQVWLHEGEVLDARVGALRGERALNRLFLWNQGEFALQADAPLPSASIELPTRSLLFEGRRRQKEWDRLLPSLPGLQGILEVDESKRNQRVSVIPDDLELVLGLCDGNRDLQQVIEESGLDEVAALELCSRLFGNGMLRAPRPPNAASVPEPAPIPQVRRLEVTTTPPRPAESDDPLAWGGAAADTIIEPAPSFPPHGMFASPASQRDLPAAPESNSSAERWSLRSANAQDTLIDDAPMLASDLLPDAPARSTPSAHVAISFRAPEEEATPAYESPQSEPDARLGGEDTPSDSLQAHAPLVAEPQPNDGSPAADAPAQSPASAPAGSPENEPAWFDLKAGGTQNDALASQVPPGSENQAAGDPLSTAPEVQSALPGDAPTTDAASDAPQEKPAPTSSANAADAPPPQSATPGNDARDASDPESSGNSNGIDDTHGAAPGAANENGVDAASSRASTANPAEGDERDDAADAFMQRPASASKRTERNPRSNASDDPDDDLIAELNSGKRVGLFIAGATLMLVILALIYAFLQSGTDDSPRPDAGVTSTVAQEATPQVAAPVPETPASTAPEPAGAAEAPSPPAQTDNNREAKAKDRKARTAAPRPEKKESKERKKREQTSPTNVEQAPTVEKPNAKKEDEIYTQKLKEAEKLTKQNNFRDAIAAYLAALEVRANSGEAHLGLGNAYYEVNEVKNAIRHLEKAKVLLRNDPQVFVLLGAVYQTANRTKDAVSAYERYLELAPDGRYARDVRNLLIGLKGQ